MVEQPSVSVKVPRAVLVDTFGQNLEFSKELAPLSSFGTGGKAKYFISAMSADGIISAIRGAKKLNIPCFVIGGGSNLLVSDEGYEGLIIKVNVLGMRLASDMVIESGAGEDLMDLVHFATANSLTSLEFAAGIWGSVGGAVYGNAGAYGGEIGSVVSELTLLHRDGRTETVSREYCQFGYRDSCLKKTGDVIVSARFALKRGDKAAISARVDEILRDREAKHPSHGNSAGCFFKNITDRSQPHGKLPAGKLLEEAGVKHLSVGGAHVYEKHANIIVNSGNATSKDIRQLADIMKRKVLDRFGVELEQEVIQIGKF